MKLVGYFHLYPKEHNAGSETTVHAAFRAMARRGHNVTVVCDRSATAPYTIDGIDVVRPPRRHSQRWLMDFVKDADLLVTHLDLTSQAMQLALNTGKPLAHFIHNSMQLKYWGVDSDKQVYNSPDPEGQRIKCHLAIFNSHWIAEAEAWPGPQIIIHPVVEAEHYRCERGDSITLVNPTSGKGASTFYDLARMMPQRQFLTAQGGYGHQVACPTKDRHGQQLDLTGRVSHDFYFETGEKGTCGAGLANVTHLKNDPDIRNVLRRTKVLLMPSDYESYGRIAVEAACAGIPTIANPTPGLKEALGDAGIFCDRDDLAAWHVEIERLFNDELYYKKRSDKVLELAASLEPEKEFDRLEQAFIETAERWRTRQERREMKMWTSDRWIWRLRDGGFKAVNDQRIPSDAVSLYAGKGTSLPESVALEHGWIGESKRIEGPAENKMIEGPAENKEKKTRKKVA